MKSNPYKIPYNRPYAGGREKEYVLDAIQRRKLSGGGGYYSGLCRDFFRKYFDAQEVFLTPSCTHALEMAALVAGIGVGDEVIIPSYTFVSSANPFVMRGANIVFADSTGVHPNVCVTDIERCISPRTKAVVVMHYGGSLCDMDAIVALVRKHGLILIEDAAHSLGCSEWKGRRPGQYGDLAAFSFHETKNVSCGEGGLLVVNRKDWVEQAEVISNKGTNRHLFERGSVPNYEWVGVGSSYLMPEMSAAYLWAQLERLEIITAERRKWWTLYAERLSASFGAELPQNVHPSHNAHIFYLTLRDETSRQAFITHLEVNGILAVFHYSALNTSLYGREISSPRACPNAEHFTRALVRLPLLADFTEQEFETVVSASLLFKG